MLIFLAEERGHSNQDRYIYGQDSLHSWRIANPDTELKRPVALHPTTDRDILLILSSYSNMKLLLLPAVFLLLLTQTCLVSGFALRCTDHPIHTAGMGSVMAYAWRFIHAARFSFANYHPRYRGHTWAPRENLGSTKYKGLDWFWANSGTYSNASYVTLFLQRRSRVYLVVTYSYNPAYPRATLPGWRPEGYVQLVDGEKDVFKYGVQQSLTRWLPSSAYVFSKLAGPYVHLPERGWVRDNVGGIESSGDWYVMLAETNGAAPAPPKNPAGISVPIVPNQKCPDSLHDRWVTRNTDDKDRDTRGKMWRTWHPMWDPCYWCAYNHEHGSSAKQLMGYEPKYEYTAYKNNREQEDHNGFKGVVFRHGPYFVYWSIHAHTSSVRRVSVRLHTVTIAVTNVRTKELLVELTHKGFFGFLAARVPSGFLALSPVEQRIREAVESDNWGRNKRSVNVIDINNLNPAYLYRTPESAILRGQYEDWTTGPICTGRGRDGMITVDFTNPSTGIKSAARRGDKVLLGGNIGSKFIRNDGSSRILILSNFVLSADNCVFKLANIKGGRSVNGVFYTNPAGDVIEDGPGRDRVRQFMKPGFEMRVKGLGIYETGSTWLGMFENRTHVRGQSSYGFPIDPEVN